MNTLGRDIKKGGKVVLKSSIFKGDTQARTFICESGSGMRIATFGTAIFGQFLDGEKARIEGVEIDVTETEAIS